MIYLGYLRIILFLIVTAAESIYTIVVQTESGPVRGEILLTARQALEYTAFKGIPYAESPVGTQRFQPPIKKAAWANVLNATKEGSVCIQYNQRNSSIIGSEDCLFINVYTPHTKFSDIEKSSLKAVMVWIYGGAFIEGYSNAEAYGPDFLLEEDVIVVSLNYRLGAFGFLNVNHENASGNAGLKDQNLALKWVNENAARFGGDPERVTIFGQSAGAVSVDLHVLSNMSAGLFNQSISMSGSPLCLYWGIQSQVEAKLRAFTLAALLGIKAKNKDDLLKALYEIPASEIVMKTSKMDFLPFRPTIEIPSVAQDKEKFLSECAVDKYRSGDYSKGRHVMGFTSDEAKSFMKSGGFQPQFLREQSELLNRTIKELTDYASDIFFVTGIDTKQQLLKEYNGYPIFYYRFSFEDNKSCTSDNCDKNGVGHAEDVPYLFYSPLMKNYTDDPDEQVTIKRYVRLFANFAKYGNPTPDDMQDPLIEITWPDSGTLGLHLEINKNLSIGRRPISRYVEDSESAGLGSSRMLNGCIF